MDSTWDPATVEVVGNIFADDPYLAYQPAFAYTLPIQLIVNGMTLTLLCVLLLHLLCTCRVDISATKVKLNRSSHDPVPLSARAAQLRAAAHLYIGGNHLRHRQDHRHHAKFRRKRRLVAIRSRLHRCACSAGMVDNWPGRRVVLPPGPQ